MNLRSLAILLASIAHFASSAAAQTAPPVSADDVASSIYIAGGPNLGGLLQQGDDPNSPTAHDYSVGLDAAGRPVAEPPYVYLFTIHLSYVRDGSGGYAWMCYMQVWKLGPGLAELTNAGSNGISLEVLEWLIAGRPHWVAFNDRETVKKFDAMLDRTPREAVTKAFRDLQAGMTGTIRTQMPR